MEMKSEGEKSEIDMYIRNLRIVFNIPAINIILVTWVDYVKDQK